MASCATSVLNTRSLVGESLDLRGEEEVPGRLLPIRLTSGGMSSSDELLSSLESQY